MHVRVQANRNLLPIELIVVRGYVGELSLVDLEHPLWKMPYIDGGRTALFRYAYDEANTDSELGSELGSEPDTGIAPDGVSVVLVGHFIFTGPIIYADPGIYMLSFTVRGEERSFPICESYTFMIPEYTIEARQDDE